MGSSSKMSNNTLFTSRVLERMCASVGSPRALTVWKLYQSGEHKQLAELVIDPKHYIDPLAFHLDYTLTCFLSKYIGLTTGVDTADVALAGFKTSEDRNRVSNSLFRDRASGRVSFSPRCERVLWRARSKIARVLRGFEIEDMITNSRPGPGATFDLKGLDACVDNKVLSTSVTHACLPYARLLLEDPLRFEALTGQEVGGPFTVLKELFEVVPGNRFTTVPKSAKTDRGIAIEPTLNVELQLGLGSFIRRRLKSVAGIDLDDQSRNQLGAKLAYDWGFATLDLSSASDTVCLEVVYDLLPVDFANLLGSLRSPSTFVDGIWHKNEKFSSMGCGFTFELETLIFWAIASSASDDPNLNWALVYGDDIIVDQLASKDVIHVLTSVGFLINETKSFVDGVFFESCGKHYFRGIDVTPIYQKELLELDDRVLLEAVYRLGNRLRRLAYRMGDGVGCLRVFHSPWSVCASVSKHFLPWSNHFGLIEEDTGLLLSRSECTSRGLYDHVFPTLSFKPLLKKRFNALAVYAHTLRCPSLTPLSEGLAVRRRGRYVVRRRRIHFGLSDTSWI